ncbi:PAQR family membrane homeostasis protein TrhA [Kordiimonas aquimaris]|uniref:PAQR family membrane homeostasis protein TrhA n=1 Tax=Kordiimonas aquimaris TaxID=707591 RepID=UPI0021D1AA16|nr:hemolysin III family protein [Kordiimonas aquimaris]
MAINAVHPYSLREEILHATSHGVAAMLAVIGLVLLLMKVDAGAVGIVAVSLYGGAMIMMFAASALYHSLFATRAQRFLKTLDHSAIYLKIAGGYAPFALLSLPTTTGLWVMIGAWSAAAVGIGFKLAAFFRGTGKSFNIISLVMYLAMGWAGVLMIDPLSDALPGIAINWIIAGGLAYTIGAIFYALKMVPYTHFVWHLFVVGGATCHFVAIYFFVI